MDHSTKGAALCPKLLQMSIQLVDYNQLLSHLHQDNRLDGMGRTEQDSRVTVERCLKFRRSFHWCQGRRDLFNRETHMLFWEIFRLYACYHQYLEMNKDLNYRMNLCFPTSGRTWVSRALASNGLLTSRPSTHYWDTWEMIQSKGMRCELLQVGTLSPHCLQLTKSGQLRVAGNRYLLSTAFMTYCRFNCFRELDKCPPICKVWSS